MDRHNTFFTCGIDSISSKETKKTNKEILSKQYKYFQKRREGLVLLSRGKRSERFFTEDSGRYITSIEEVALSRKYVVRHPGYFDGVRYRQRKKSKIAFQNRVSYFTSAQMRSYWTLRRSFLGMRSSLESIPDNIRFRITPFRVWKFSLVAAMIFGMVSMSLIYRYLGQGVMANAKSSNKGSDITASTSLEEDGIVAGEEDVSQVLPIDKVDVDSLADSFPLGENMQESSEKVFQKRAREMVKGYPIERMLPYILKRDKIVAAYLISIAKKESSWGQRVPIYQGYDCYNYWGYRGQREIMGTGGHTCFENMEDAVKTVGDRLEYLIKEAKLNTPASLIVWKCGSTCAGHSDYSVRKWISDVDLYFSKLYVK